MEGEAGAAAVEVAEGGAEGALEEARSSLSRDSAKAAGGNANSGARNTARSCDKNEKREPCGPVRKMWACCEIRPLAKFPARYFSCSCVCIYLLHLHDEFENASRSSRRGHGAAQATRVSAHEYGLFYAHQYVGEAGDPKPPGCERTAATHSSVRRIAAQITLGALGCQ
jgi:hypothetical protein